MAWMVEPVNWEGRARQPNRAIFAGEACAGTLPPVKGEGDFAILLHDADIRRMAIFLGVATQDGLSTWSPVALSRLRRAWTPHAPEPDPHLTSNSASNNSLAASDRSPSMTHLSATLASMTKVGARRGGDRA